ncbi:hypothetical protein U1872_11300 [Sphingomonas sp. RB3P16]|uniref:hypothetical protein n=1 Tax=Parasphingomonas frigoris TaxID=3096163 RepID=UPI002FCA5ECA
MTPAGRGRPLRFLLVVAVAWTMARIATIWPQPLTGTDVLPTVAPIAVAAAAPPPPTRHAVFVAPSARYVGPRLAAARIAAPGPAVARARPAPRAAPTPMPVAPGLLQSDDPHPVAASGLLPGLPQALSVRPPRGMASRWSGSAWLVARGGAGVVPGALGGQLGGSQAGVRIAYALDRPHRIALVGRMTTPLGNGLREAAFGVEWQPTRLPIRLMAERRFALAPGRGGPALGVVGGIGPVGVPLGFRLEAYGQAGVIRRVATEPYADGAARALRSLLTTDTVRLELGAGAWGGAQRGAARLDIGPSLGLTLPIGRQPVRLALDCGIM